MKIEQLKATSVIYQVRIGAYGPENYALMANFKQQLAEHKLFGEETIIYALAYDNPLMTPLEKCRYEVAATVSSFPQDKLFDYGCGELPRGNYFVLVVAHTAVAINQAMSEMLPVLASQGHDFDGSRPIIERYQSRLLKDELCEIAFPIK